MNSPRKSRAGMTMLEVVIASAILIAIVIMVFLLLFSASEEESMQQTMIHMDNQILQVLNRIAEDIRNSGGIYSQSDPFGVELLTPKNAPAPEPFPSNLGGPTDFHYSLSFGLNTGFQIVGKTGSAIFNQTTVRYYWRPAVGEVPDNGIDDNKDGFIDDGLVVREETTGGVTTTSILSTNVSQRGLVFQVYPDLATARSVTISLELVGKDRKNQILKRRTSVSAGARSRN